MPREIRREDKIAIKMMYSDEVERQNSELSILYAVSLDTEKDLLKKEKYKSQLER